MEDVGRSLVFAGCALAAVGLIIWAGARMSWFGRLPGDVAIETTRASVFAPFTSMLILSIVLTVVLNLVSWWRR